MIRDNRQIDIVWLKFHFIIPSFYTCGMNVLQLWYDCLTRVEYSFDTCGTICEIKQIQG